MKCHGVSPLSTAVGARFIAREDPHSKCIKCLGFSHARDAVYGTSKCKIYEDFRLITLRSRLEACEKESSISPRRAPGTSVASHEFAASREASASHEATTWGPDVELAEVKSEQTGLTFSLPSACVQIHQLNSCMIFYFLARGHVIPFVEGMALHTMVILQAYQADVLKEMDEGTGLTPEAMKELRRATDLALRATKHTARAAGRSMTALVAAERHLWLNLTDIREREKVFLLDAPISQSGLFGEAVSAVLDKAKTQLAALKQFMLRRSRDYSTPSSSVSREQSLPRKEPSGGGAQATHPSPTKVWGAHGRSFPRQQQRKRVNLKRPNRPATSANPGRS